MSAWWLHLPGGTVLHCVPDPGGGSRCGMGKGEGWRSDRTDLPRCKRCVAATGMDGGEQS